jgi:predicted transcriptional regulator
MAKSPKISSRLKELQNAVAEKNGWTREKLIKDFEKVKEKCLQEVEVTAFDKETGTHVGTGEYVFKEQGVIKALENIGKLLGMYEEKIKHSGEINIIKVKPPKFGKETEE